MAKEEAKPLNAVLAELRQKQIQAMVMVEKHTAEAKRWKEEVKSIVSQITTAIDEDSRPNLFTKPAPKEPEKPGTTYNVDKSGTVEVVKPAETAKPEEKPAETEKKKRGRKPKAETNAAPAETIEPAAETKAPEHNPFTDRAQVPRPEGNEWKNVPCEGNLIGIRPQDLFALEDAGVKTLGQLAAMIDSGLLMTSESISKAAAERAKSALQNWFSNNAAA